MISKTTAYTLVGLDGIPITVEVDINNGLPAFDIVGLADTAVKESKERVRSAIKNSGFKVPTRKITANLAPADVKKEGSVYDLPLLLALLCASGQLKADMKNIFVNLVIWNDLKISLNSSESHLNTKTISERRSPSKSLSIRYLFSLKITEKRIVIW